MEHVEKERRHRVCMCAAQRGSSAMCPRRPNPTLEFELSYLADVKPTFYRGGTTTTAESLAELCAAIHL